MPDSYFRKFPTIYYNNQECTDIVSGATLVDKFINMPYSYYPYDVTQAKRADVVSAQYYDDSYFDWLIYYANKIVDPYYGWTMSDQDFTNFLNMKYGSTENAIKKIAFYRTNWYNDDRTLSEDVFYGTISSAEQKYWTMKYDEVNGILMSFVRKPVDIMMNTNRIITLDTINVGTFVTGDLVDIRRDATDVGTAEVLVSNTTSVTLKNTYITGLDFTYGDVIRHDSNTDITATIQDSDTSIYDDGIIEQTINIPLAEGIYWEPVTMYDVENEKNIDNKSIRLVDNRLAALMSSTLTDLMRQ